MELTNKEKIEGLIGELQSILNNEEKLICWTTNYEQNFSFGGNGSDSGIDERIITIKYKLKDERLKGCASKFLMCKPIDFKK